MSEDDGDEFRWEGEEGHCGRLGRAVGCQAGREVMKTRDRT